MNRITNAGGKQAVTPVVMLIVCLIAMVSCKSALVTSKPEIQQASVSNGYPAFEDGKVWLNQDGTARVRTFDGMEAIMKSDKVASYLAKYKGYNTTRMSIRPTYPIDGLADVQRYAEQLYAKGIKVSVAGNDEMLENMTMPEYRRARIYDCGNGEYRFELDCNSQFDYQKKYPNLTITGSVELMEKWISMFDGHGVAIYPESMPYADAARMAEAAWKSGKGQVSLIDRKKVVITVIPAESKLEDEYPGCTAAEVAERLNAKVTTDYYAKGTRLQEPRNDYNAESRFFHVSDVIRTPDETILTYSAWQGPDLWLTAICGNELYADGKSYKSTRHEGLNGFEDAYFWSPDDGTYIMNEHFPPLPDDVETVDLRDAESHSLIIKNLQVSPNAKAERNYTSRPFYGVQQILRQSQPHPDQPDVISVQKGDFSDKETVIYMQMAIMEPRTFLGYVGSDFKLTLADGQTLNAVRVDGVPTDEDFDRHGDHVTTPFQLVFPPISVEDWTKGEHHLTGVVCHEDVDFAINGQSSAILTSTAPAVEFPEKTFTICSVSIALKTISQMPKPTRIASITFDGKDKMIVKGDESGILGDGEFTISDRKIISGNQGQITISGNGKEFVMKTSHISALGIDLYEMESLSTDGQPGFSISMIDQSKVKDQE